VIARAAFIALAAALLAGCAALPVPGCAGGGEPRLVADLLFGRNIGDRLGVSDAAFARFVDAEVTPRFPDGLSILDARGQYRDRENGRLVREPSKIVTIVLGDEARDQPKLTAIAEAYKARFRQQSVGIVTRRACVSF
jgi:hypothetical protein